MKLFFLLLVLALLSSPAIAQSPPNNTGLWNDRSAVVANQSNYVANASRFNHLMVGELSTKNNNFSSPPSSWMDALIPNVMLLGQIGVSSTIGAGGINSASRTSDARTTWGGSASQGSAGGYLIGVNDDPGAGSPIALGINGVGIHQAGTGITLGTQMDINSVVPTCVPSPAAPFCAGAASTVGNLITSGAFASLATQDTTSALMFSSGATAKFKAGLVIDGSAIRSAAGQPILGANSTIGIAMPSTHYIIWYNNVSPSSAVWGGSAGNLNLFATGTLVVNGVAGVNCHGINLSTIVVTKGIITHC